ncbi:uncharacterized protein B0P05DRAFT_567736 [Gilbertella persicaria]|uniref:uncharacterized protein n=1 Tax=Gilbertella persicaria TaxID=101096 RepID=UPI00221E9E2D|nr:uncharacterized protein B0P05DRAFT_567736 [Gilbertella persicaria]KAI8098394.1 hypothetical protein B0P05DRAFT_567736 [Gilbertella persicaria]
MKKYLPLPTTIVIHVIENYKEEIKNSEAVFGAKWVHKRCVTKKDKEQCLLRSGEKQVRADTAKDGINAKTRDLQENQISWAFEDCYRKRGARVSIQRNFRDYIQKDYQQNSPWMWAEWDLKKKEEEEEKYINNNVLVLMVALEALGCYSVASFTTEELVSDGFENVKAVFNGYMDDPHKQRDLSNLVLAI